MKVVLTTPLLENLFILFFYPIFFENKISQFCSKGANFIAAFITILYIFSILVDSAMIDLKKLPAWSYGNTNPDYLKLDTQAPFEGDTRKFAKLRGDLNPLKI